jgi:hypothetical protein
VEIESVVGVAGGVNRLRPKPIMCLVLIKHGSCHIQKAFYLLKTLYALVFES